MIISEFKRIMSNKSFWILSLLTLIILISNTSIGYLSCSNDYINGVAYEYSGLGNFEPQNIFFYSMLNLTTSIYIFPFIIFGVVLIYDDIKYKFLMRVAIIKKNKFSYFINKFLVLLLYNIVMILLIFLVTVILSINFKNTIKENADYIFSVYTLLSIILYWIGISFFCVLSMMVTVLFNSAIVGNCVNFYILFERIFTSNTAIQLRNEVVMKINELLPWANFNTLFVYASNLEYLINNYENDLSGLSSTLTMFMLVETYNTIYAIPYFKDLTHILLICTFYFIVIILLYFYACKQSIRKV